MGKAQPVFASSDRSPPPRRIVALGPVFLTAFVFFVWAACNSVVPLSVQRSDYCSRDKSSVPCNVLVRNRGVFSAHNEQHAFSVAGRGGSVVRSISSGRSRSPVVASSMDMQSYDRDGKQPSASLQSMATGRQPYAGSERQPHAVDERQAYTSLQSISRERQPYSYDDERQPHASLQSMSTERHRISTVTTSLQTAAEKQASRIGFNDSQNVASFVKPAVKNHQKEDDDITGAIQVVERIMKDLRRSARPLHSRSDLDFVLLNPQSDAKCEGRRVFMYDLPNEFNVDLLHHCFDLLPWQNMCEFLCNSGMGRRLASSSSKESAGVLVPSTRWHETHQYALEVLFHERMKHYKCLTTSPEIANMFYIPYYGGLDVLRWHFNQNTSAMQIDELGEQLIRWLKEQPTWRRKKGLDHVLVLGKITWDFRRAKSGMSGRMWGSSLLLQEDMQNVTKLLIERQPWQEDEVGVPHPTFFHPMNDEDIRAWQAHIGREKRAHLVSFAGQPRPKQAESIRSHLIRQCGSAASSCRLLDCGGHRCLHPNTTMEVFLHSEFCMQPPGDSPTRRSIFDSLVAGCIPVLFDPYSAYYQYPWHLPEKPELYSVYIKAEDVRNGRVNVIDELRRIPKSVRQEMRRRIVLDIMPGLVYARPDGRLKELEDAFVVSLRGLFARISQRLSERPDVFSSNPASPME